MENLKGGIFITPKDIQILTNGHIVRARIDHLAVRDALGKTSKKLTVREYCDYHQLDYDTVVAHINTFR